MDDFSVSGIDTLGYLHKNILGPEVTPNETIVSCPPTVLCPVSTMSFDHYHHYYSKYLKYFKIVCNVVQP